jgi:AcrR family transcriptional regulator
MGVTERKEREKELKRASMLEAAEALILEKGLDSLNMDEVADKAEVSKGSLYQYFNNKNDLVLGVCNKATSLLSEEIQKVLTQDLPGLELVRAIGVTFMSFVTDHPEYFRAMRFHDDLKESNISDESQFMDSCNDNMKAGFTCMVRAIQIGMQDGSINPSYDAKELAIILWATSYGMVKLAYQHYNVDNFTKLEVLEVDPKNVFEGYMKVIGCGIATETEQAKYDSKSFFETNEGG